MSKVSEPPVKGAVHLRKLRQRLAQLPNTSRNKVARNRLKRQIREVEEEVDSRSSGHYPRSMPQ